MTSPIFYKDFYKVDHRRQYPEGTQEVYSNLTARSSRMPNVKEIVVFGVQYFVEEYLIRRFNQEFFQQPKTEVIAKYKRRIDNALGPNQVGTKHLEELHDLRFLPLLLKALPEGTKCPLRVPMLTIKNTAPEFFWLTNYVETILSNVLWHPMTSATIAHEYHKLLTKYAEKTSDTPEFVQWQGHDFSMRGHSSFESSCVSGAAHLLSFTGSDTIPAIDFLEEYYNADCERELIGGSVAATEHSVMCMGGKDDERETYFRLITQVYPNGIVSIVSDTWDYWHVLDKTIRGLKDVIMARDGKLVIRPDSGDPFEIICGGHGLLRDTVQGKGTIELLWDIFGGTVNSKGYKQLDPHIGCIYGDSITLERCEAICKGLEAKGFASTNMVFGIGSYTYQYVTRDTFGFAVKATNGIVAGKSRELFKTPATDNGVKFSAKGLLRVNADLSLSESVSPVEETEGLLRPVFMNGKLLRKESLSVIRKRLLEA